jgi:hypothetical protein
VASAMALTASTVASFQCSDAPPLRLRRLPHVLVAGTGFAHLSVGQTFAAPARLAFLSWDWRMSDGHSPILPRRAQLVVRASASASDVT